MSRNDIAVFDGRSEDDAARNLPKVPYRNRKAVKQAADRDLDTTLNGRNALVRESTGRAVDTAKVVTAHVVVSGVENARHHYMGDLIANAADEGGLVLAVAEHYDLPPAYASHLLVMAESSQRAAAQATTGTLLGLQDHLVAGILRR